MHSTEFLSVGSADTWGQATPPGGAGHPLWDGREDVWSLSGSAHQMPVAPHAPALVSPPNTSPDVVKCPLGDKPAPIWEPLH